jgi:hypothetical protein
VKQHIILDVVVGIFWAFADWSLGGYVYHFWVDCRLDACAGLRQMTRKLAPVFFSSLSSFRPWFA